MTAARSLRPAERVNGRIKTPLYLREDLFHRLRRMAEREQTSIGEVVEDILRTRFGG